MSKKPEKQTAKPAGRKPAKAGPAAVAKSVKPAAQAARTTPASGRIAGAATTAKRVSAAAAKRPLQASRAKTSRATPGKAAAPARKAAPRTPASRPGTPARDQAKAKATRQTAVPAVSKPSVKKPPTVRFSDADLKEFHDQLMKLRNDLVGKVTFLRNSSLQREDEVNHAEDGSDAFDRLFSLERVDGVQSRIYAIDEALREIADGTYGICQNCDSLIRKPRLLALPFARNCIECQAAQERKRNGQGAPAAPRRLIP